MKRFRLSPSDFAWTYDSCKRCYYRKLHGLQPYGQAMPRMYRIADEGMKAKVTHEHLQTLGVPADRLLDEMDRLTSAPIDFPDLGVSLTVAGRLDRAALNHEGVVVLEYKSGKPDRADSYGYWRQVHAYAKCLEFPLVGSPQPVSAGWVVYCGLVEDGYKVKETSSGVWASFMGRLTAIETTMDRDRFDALLRSVAELMAGESPPADSSCAFCAAVAEAGRFDASQGGKA